MTYYYERDVSSGTIEAENDAEAVALLTKHDDLLVVYTDESIPFRIVWEKKRSKNV